MHFVNKKDSAENGDVFIRYVIPNRGIKYQLFKNSDSNPYLIDVSFRKLGEEKLRLPGMCGHLPDLFKAFP